MSEQRRVRFATIEGLAREDLPLAGEVWLDDIYRAPWASREAMKLAAHFVRYMGLADPAQLVLREIEREYQMVRDDVQRALVLLRTFGAVEAFALEKDDLKVALNLSLLQRLRVLQTRKELDMLMSERTGQPITKPLPVREPRWNPPAPSAAADPAREAATPLLAMISEHIRDASAALNATSARAIPCPDAA
jgi:hypothetical protein